LAYHDGHCSLRRTSARLWLSPCPQATAIRYLSIADAVHGGRQPSSGVLWELRSANEDDVALHAGASVSILSQFANENE
jgi:hypothetical protein